MAGGSAAAARALHNAGAAPCGFTAVNYGLSPFLHRAPLI